MYHLVFYNVYPVYLNVIYLKCWKELCMQTVAKCCKLYSWMELILSFRELNCRKYIKHMLTKKPWISFIRTLQIRIFTQTLKICSFWFIILHIINSNISDGGLYICRARNEKMQNQAVVDITVLQGKVPIQCQDQPKLANCALIVRAKYCARNENFARICCQSCVNSGQIAGPPA